MPAAGEDPRATVPGAASPAPVDPEVVRRRAEVAEAGHRGDAAEARRATADPDPGVRAAALGALRRAGGLTAEAVEAALADPSPVVRRRVAEELAAAWGPEGAGVEGAEVSVVALLDDDDATVVEVAAWALGERTPPEPGTVEALGALAVDHEDALVREAAVAALGAIGDPAGLPAVLAATGDRATVRRRAVLALAPFEGPEVDDALHRATGDRDWQVRQAAEDLLR